MKNIPQTKDIDSVSSIVSQGYDFVSNKCEKLKTDIFSTRLMMRDTICMRGKQAAKVFYNPEYFERKDVAPNPVKSTLLGHGGVQGLDGKHHAKRKEMFMDLMELENIHRLAKILQTKWIQYATEWEDMDEVVLFYEVEKLLCEAICEWTGVPLEKDEISERARDFGHMIEGAGGMGLKKHVQGRKARNKAEKWIEELVEKIRNNSSEDSGNADIQHPLYYFSFHRDENGDFLDAHTVAVEILNLLRPTVAVSRYIIFAALALHVYPENKSKILTDNDYLTFFVHEVRRFYPFFPFNMARAKKDFTWNGYSFSEGQHVLLDFYGTNHHPDLWENPDTFDPERFRNQEIDAFNLIPQGGGEYILNHRCAGEDITIELMKQAVHFLTQSIEYEVPDQDLEIDLSVMPAIPKSRFIIYNVQFNSTDTS